MKVLFSDSCGSARGLVRMSAVVESAGKPTPEEVAEKVGYRPAGYGCYSPVITQDPASPGYWVVFWSRSASCD